MSTVDVVINGQSFRFYASKRAHRAGIRMMAGLIESFEGRVKFYQPDKDKAPWHMKAHIGDTDINIWYTKQKASIDDVFYFGQSQISVALLKILQDAEDDKFDVIDDGE